MKEEYTNEYTLKTNKSVVYSVLADPYVFAGISGHIVLYKVFDRAKNDFVAQGSAVNPENKFKAAFVFHDQDGNARVADGVLEGPILLPNQVNYKGVSNDGKLRGSFYFSIKDNSNELRLIVRAELEYEDSFFSLFSRGDYKKRAKWYGNMAQHLVEQHLVWYLSRLGPSLNFNLKEVERVSGDMREILLKLRDLPKISTGYLLIKGEGFRLVGKVVDGVLQSPRLTVGNDVLTGEAALGKLFLLSGKAEMALYVADVDEAVLERL